MNGKNCLDCLSEIDLDFSTLHEYIKSNFNMTDLMISEDS